MWTLELCLKHIGIPTKITKLIVNSIQANTAYLKINNKLSNGIKITKGLKQGCVISPTLFNIFINPLIQQLEKIIHEFQPNITPHPTNMAFADDIGLTSNTEENLDKQLSIIQNFCDITGLELGVAEFGKEPKTAITTSDTKIKQTEKKWNQRTITKLSEEENYKYLGAHISLKLDTTTLIKNKINRFNSTTNQIAYKALPLSTKTELINMYSSGFMNYFLTFIPPSEEINKLLEEADKKTRNSLKRGTKLPLQFNNEIFYLPRNKAGFGLMKLTDIHKKAYASLIIDRIITKESNTKNYIEKLLEEDSYINKGLQYALKDDPEITFKKTTTKTQKQEDTLQIIGNNLTIFGDGSVKNGEMTAAIYCEETENIMTAQIDLEPHSSTLAELSAFELMLQNTTDSKITWIQDSKPALDIINKIIKGEKTSYPKTTERIKELLNKRTQPITLRWFPSHHEIKLLKNQTKWKPILDEIKKELGEQTFKKYKKGNETADKATQTKTADTNLESSKEEQETWKVIYNQKEYDGQISKLLQKKRIEKQTQKMEGKYKRWQSLYTKTTNDNLSNPYNIMNKEISHPQINKTSSKWTNINADFITKTRHGTFNLFKYNPKSSPKKNKKCLFCQDIDEGVDHFYEDCPAYEDSRKALKTSIENLWGKNQFSQAITNQTTQQMLLAIIPKQKAPTKYKDKTLFKSQLQNHYTICFNTLYEMKEIRKTKIKESRNSNINEEEQTEVLESQIETTNNQSYISQLDLRSLWDDPYTIQYNSIRTNPPIIEDYPPQNYTFRSSGRCGNLF
eukprot:TRINITY_DN1461_c0_g1_i3.p1 TRINITY_DN1461_c0_g1~~TRINITY_DN1461_c0_g1_i3.p1  ORF type:complete len:795 (-),score=89.35 TRINITY_DN1461_c0_g1_i3:312-2696(-)